MSSETTSPSAAVLRNLLTSLSLDLAHAPLKNRNYNRLTKICKQFLTLEKTMAATSEQVGNAMGHATELMEEARNWEVLSEEHGILTNVMEQSIRRVAGVGGIEKEKGAERGEMKRGASE